MAARKETKKKTNERTTNEEEARFENCLKEIAFIMK